MIQFNLWNIAFALFLSTTGMACLYTLLSFLVLFTGYKTLKGKELRNIVGILMYAMLIGFVYACWQFLLIIANNYAIHTVTHIFLEYRRRSGGA